MNNPIEQFKSAIAAAGMTPPDSIEPGKIHRFPGSGKGRANTAGRCFMFPDMRGGWYEDFSAGLEQTNWQAHGSQPYTDAERQANIERSRFAKAAHEAEKERTHVLVAGQAQKRFDAAADCIQHPYLAARGVQAHGLKVEPDGTLLVPMREKGKLWSIERINPRDFKDKRGLEGGRRKGLYHLMGGAPVAGRVLVASGYATAASCFEAMGVTTFVAFNDSNLPTVAKFIREASPDLQVIVCADDDYQNTVNSGWKYASEAAAAIGAYLAVPDFGANRPDGATDFNDLHQTAGLAAVKACIEAAMSKGVMSKAATESIADGTGNTCAGGINDTDNGDGGNDVGIYAWAEPTPLPDALPPVMAFDADLLPVALRGWVMDIAHRMQCPADFPAVAALVALSSLIGARAVVQPKARDDWQVVPNLWGVVVGRPGVKKSPALSEALKPLHRLEAAEFELHQAAHDAWELDCKVAAMQSDANEKKAKTLASKDPAAARALLEPMDTPAEPAARRFVVNDATVEKLGELMQQNPWGTLSYRDELYGLLTSLDKQGQEGSRSFYLQGYDGNQGYTFDRIMRGTLRIPRVCLAMLGGIQPGRVQEYVRGAVAGGSADDGLLQRFGLAVWPDTAGEFVHVDQWPDTPAKQTAWAVFERLAQLAPASEAEPNVWRFSPEAQAVFVEWLVPFENELRSDDLHPAMVSHLAKYRKLIPAMALVFALIDTPDSGGVIHETELIRALAWCDYLRTHANRLYAAAVMPETTTAAALLAKLRAGKLADRDGVILDSFTPRLIAQKCWAGLATPDAVRKAADVLVDYDHLRKEVQQTGATGGRPSDRYIINPSTLTARGTV